MPSSGPSRLPYVLAALSVIALDRITKIAVVRLVEPRGSIAVIPGFFDLTYVRNPGGVFGILKNLDNGVRGLLFTIVPVIAIALIIAYARRIPADHRLTQTALAAILGGAAGNLMDRFRFGYVIDFLDVYWRSYHWPAFNVADSAICIGVGLLMAETLLSPERASAAPAGPETVSRDLP